MTMTSAEAFVGRLFGTPGNRNPNAKELAKDAALAHADLLVRASAQGDPTVTRSLAPLVEFLRRGPPASERRRLLCHPLFIEGLHSLAPFCAPLRRWHDSVASPSAPEQCAPDAKASLGNVALVILLCSDPQWRGDLDLCTDVLGRLGFPFCNWSVTLLTQDRDFVATRLVKFTLGRNDACWRLEDAEATPFLVMSRDDCLKMLVGNSDQLDGRRLKYPNPRLRPRLQWASPLLNSTIRYDPIGFQDGHDHAGQTGGLVQHVLSAIRRNSPDIYHELRAFIHIIRAFDLPPRAYGVVASFSDPTLPGVMGINITYTAQHEPCADACCFTWFGHELGHTKDYLIDNVLYARGQSFLRNAVDQTNTLPRYGRSFSVRTLFQIPYVHLYEWALLMDFWEQGFRGLPWRVAVDAKAVGEDLAAEIEEAFALIQDQAQLTRMGLAALRHFQRIFDRAQVRWRSILSRREKVPAADSSVL
jgi:hypothetical protein